jgi:hypothetical protein
LAALACARGSIAYFDDVGAGAHFAQCRAQRKNGGYRAIAARIGDIDLALKDTHAYAFSGIVEIPIIPTAFFIREALRS